MDATTYNPGDFSFMDKDSEVMLKDMYDAVSSTDNWANLKGFVPGDGGFMFCDKPAWFSQINAAMKYDGHSGSSYGWTMRNIEFIAKHGWDNFVLKHTKTNTPPLPSMPPMGVPLTRSIRSMSGMPAPASVFRHHPSMTEEENKNADVAERYQPSHQAEAYQMRVYTDALMKRKDLFAADAAVDS